MEQIILEDLLHNIFLKSPKNLFDEFIEKCQDFYERPVHNLIELKSRTNTKMKGDIFEEFCVLYLKNIKNYTNVWRLQDVPMEKLKILGLKRKDMGIDIIAEKNGLYSAIQCKYKKINTNKSKNVLSWKALSTFYALCMCSGLQDQNNKREWTKHIVMTNCDYVRHVGEKTVKDLSICLKTFQNISKDQWLSLCNVTYHRLNNSNNITNNENNIINNENNIINNKNNIINNENNESNGNKVLSKEELRKKRLLFYDK